MYHWSCMFYKRRIYLDYAAATPVDPRVERFVGRLKKYYGNPSSIHKEGLDARRILNESRTKIARLAQVKTDEIFFTASGTESNNICIQGVVNAYNDSKSLPHIITTSIEHASVLEVCHYLERKNKAEVTYLNVNKDGLIDPNDVERNLRENTVLVSVMQVNNEIGTVQPISDISKIVKNFRKDKKSKYPYFHTDAIQAPCYTDFHFERLGVDLLTLDSLKVYGPKGVGLIIKRNEIELEPIILGGGQERGLRSGTENILGIAGFAEALRIADSERRHEVERLIKLRDYCIKEVCKIFPGASLNGSASDRIANNINVCFPGVDTEFLVIKLDSRGIATSFSSSCHSKAEKSTSYVISEIGKEDCKGSSLRVTLGRFTKDKDIKTFLKELSQVLEKN